MAGLAPVSSGVPGASLCSRVVRDDHPIYPAGTVLYGKACMHTCGGRGSAPGCTCACPSPALRTHLPAAPLCARCAPAGQWFWYGSTNQDFGCYVGNAQVKWPASWPSFTFTDFSCACAVPNEPLTWEYSPDCVAGPRAVVAGGTPVCRALGRGDTLDQTLLPGYSPGTSGEGQFICDSPFFYGTRQGPPGSPLGGIELLCRGGLRAPAGRAGRMACGAAAGLPGLVGGGGAACAGTATDQALLPHAAPHDAATA